MILRENSRKSSLEKMRVWREWSLSGKLLKRFCVPLAVRIRGWGSSRLKGWHSKKWNRKRYWFVENERNFPEHLLRDEDLLWAVCWVAHKGCEALLHNGLSEWCRPLRTTDPETRAFYKTHPKGKADTKCQRPTTFETSKKNESIWETTTIICNKNLAENQNKHTKMYMWHCISSYVIQQ